VNPEPIRRASAYRAMTLVTIIGLIAAFCTTISYVPQIKKIWDTGETHDISLKMFLILAGGIALWVVYGLMQGDAVIILANSVSLAFLGAILFFKLRNVARGRG
jgi:MtN3 and saliva related transmembrane protein